MKIKPTEWILSLSLIALGSASFGNEIPFIRSSFENVVYPEIYANNKSNYPLLLTNNFQGICVGVNAFGGIYTAASSCPSDNINNHTEVYSTSNQPWLVESQLGAPVCSINADYSIGSLLVPPAGADMSTPPDLTFLTGNTNAVWINYANMLLATDQGVVQVVWKLDGAQGGTQTMIYTVSSNPANRPVRLYWTERSVPEGEPFGSPVSFAQNYRVDIYYNSQIDSNEVWIADSNLHAARGAEGQFLLTYSRLDETSGHRELLAYEIVDVLAPMSSKQSVEMGERLASLTRSFDTEDLYAEITRGAVDQTGKDEIYVYQHQAGPQKGWIWAIRETHGDAWKIEIFWKAKEELDVIWPFEIDIYDVSWGDDLQMYVRGDLAGRDYEPFVYIPMELSAAVMPYQTQDGESGSSAAFAFVESGKLCAESLGKFLLRYATEDTVWFEPVEAVSRAAATAGAVLQCPIATELMPQDTSGLYTDWPGYVYAAAGTAYNPNYYNYPEQYLDPVDIVSSIYAVNRGELEIWWPNASKYWSMTDVEAGEVKLPNPIFFPSLVNTYTNVWVVDATQIVVASGQGNNGVAEYENLGAIHSTTGDVAWIEVAELSITNGITCEGWIKPGSNASSLFEIQDLPSISLTEMERLPTSNPFGNALDFDGVDDYVSIPLKLPDTGTIELWHWPKSFYNYNSVFDNSADQDDWEMWIPTGGKLRFRIQDSRCEYDIDDLGTNQWYHIAVTWHKHGEDVDYDLWIDGVRHDEFADAPWTDPGDTFYLAGGHDNNISGSALYDEVRIWDTVRTEAEIRANMGHELTGYESRLIAYYNFNASSGDVLVDQTANGYDGTLSNMVDSAWVVNPMLNRAPVWRHFAATMVPSATNADWTDVTYYLNGELVGGITSNCAMSAGISNATLHVGNGYSGAMDEIRVWDRALDASEVEDAFRYRSTLPGPVEPLVWLRFEPGLTAVNDGSAGGTASLGTNTYYSSDTAFEALPDGMSLAGASPEIYVQADETLPGYNPNEEHALMVQETAYALRADLNINNAADYPSDPFVLVEYKNVDGSSDMVAFEVSATSLFHDFSLSMEAGQMIQAPAPLNQMVPTWCSNNKFVQGYLKPFEDRTGCFWAQQAGDNGGSTNAVAHLWYPNLESFWYPEEESHEPGEQIALSVGSDSHPVDFTYTVSWPEDVPGIYIGDTLTNPKNNLPAIRGQLSVNVIYQQSLAITNQPSVKLIDPTRARKSQMKDVPGGMKSFRDPKTGFTFFSELPTALRSRMYWNGTALQDERLQLIGEYMERTDGYNYLLLNTLSQGNRANALDETIVTGQDDVWKDAVTNMPARVVEITNDETPVDSYALSTVGRGSGYVTLIFNDSTNKDMVDPSENVNMVIIKVKSKLYQGRLDTLFSPNPLDKQLTLKYTADFAGEPQQFEFEWNYAGPVNGSAPAETNGNWYHFANTNGLHYTTIGDAGVFGLSDHYLRCRYRALDSDVVSIVGTNWVAWTPPQLCEGWIKRVMKEVNPYEQRIRDYMNYEIDTSLSMIQQAGKPYSGDIPLNYAALDDYGLIPIYETIYLQALDLCKNENVSDSLSLALMMVAGRLADFYTMLGNEAYADALNPTVTLGSDDPVNATEMSSIFCFQNQLPDLLSEELVLLRGRDAEMNPSVTEYPLYNRLAWNFTADIIGGEVAYALNYGISDLKGNQNGSLDEDDARVLFPQGHGDAWGHYLKSVKYYYAMMHASNFNWYPQVEGLLVGDTEVTVSYLHEKKFAVAAAAKARAGLDIISKTWRQDYEFGEDLSEEFVDSNTNRAWGVAEWASRTGQSTYFDWLAANSLLPDRDSDPEHEGIRVIDRVTVPELDEIAEAGRKVQQQLDGIDAELNPLGIAKNVVSFDISSAGIDAGDTHFEQIYARAEAALQNAASIFDRVQSCAQALRDQNESREFDQTLADEEAELNRRLIEIYGYPYSDDIGPGEIYTEGYEGPDLTHYSYIERYTDAGDYQEYEIHLVSYEIDGYSKGSYSPSIELYKQLSKICDVEPDEFDKIDVYIPEISSVQRTVTFCVDASGIPCKPESYTGSRRAEGEIQMTLSSFLESLAALEAAHAETTAANQAVVNLANRLSAKYLRDKDIEAAENTLGASIVGLEWTKYALERTLEIYEIWGNVSVELAKALGDAAPTAVGMTVDVGSAARYAALAAVGPKSVADAAFETAQLVVLEMLDISITELENALERAISEAEGNYELVLDLLSMKNAVAAQKVPLLRLKEVLQSAETARMEYGKSVAEGDALQVERKRLRMNHASDLNAKRYRNMAYQIFRNDELNRYSEAYDQAARYCYLTAKAYDYETGLLESDSEHMAGCDFMEDIVKARTLGRISSGGEPLVGGPVGDPGLADILARMKANWDVLDGRLSFNNPQTETGRFSLRSELFRIKPTEIGGENSDENWRETLEKCRVPNLLVLSEFQRYCLPFTPAELEEPAIVIPFSTDISFGNNFFGMDLAGGDNAYDSTHFATKIRSAGIWFSNFDNAFSGGLANQPRVYLIPVGVDRMRVPSAEMDEVRNFQVVDQALPVPYPFSEQDWASPDWSVLKDMLGNELYNIRRYPSMRGYHDSGDFNVTEVVNNSRLIGRSVWNTKWMLIIPGGTLLDDRDEGLDRFIHGREVFPGVRDENGVKDIKIFFQTYSYSGN